MAEKPEDVKDLIQQDPREAYPAWMGRMCDCGHPEEYHFDDDDNKRCTGKGCDCFKFTEA
jgi:hypothetical protein